MIVDVFDASIYDVAQAKPFGYGNYCFFGHGKKDDGHDYTAPIRGGINPYAHPRPWALYEEGYFDSEGRPILLLEHAPFKKAEAALVFLRLSSGVNGRASEFKIIEGSENVRIVAYARFRFKWNKIERQPILIMTGPAIFQWERNGRLYRGEKSTTTLKMTPIVNKGSILLLKEHVIR